MGGPTLDRAHPTTAPILSRGAARCQIVEAAGAAHKRRPGPIPATGPAPAPLVLPIAFTRAAPAACALALVATPSAAQSVSPVAGPTPDAPEWSIGAWAGGAPTSYAGHFIGATPDRALALAGVRLGLSTGRIGPVRVEYVAQVIPAALLYANPVAPLTAACGTQETRMVRGRAVTRQVPGYCRERVFGAGVLPVGVQLAAPLGRWVRAFAAGHAGGLLFAKNVPVTEARRLNFVFDFGGGLEVGPRRRGAIALGYKLHHISNAWTAPANPGLDNHVFYVGFVHRLGGRR